MHLCRQLFKHLFTVEKGGGCEGEGSKQGFYSWLFHISELFTHTSLQMNGCMHSDRTVLDL